MAVLSNYIQKLPLPTASTSPTLSVLPPPLTCGPATRSFLLASFASCSLLNTLAGVIRYVQVTSSHSVSEQATKSHCGQQGPTRSNALFSISVMFSCSLCSSHGSPSWSSKMPGMPCLGPGPWLFPLPGRLFLQFSAWLTPHVLQFFARMSLSQ